MIFLPTNHHEFEAAAGFIRVDSCRFVGNILRFMKRLGYAGGDREDGVLLLHYL